LKINTATPSNALQREAAQRGLDSRTSQPDPFGDGFAQGVGAGELVSWYFKGITKPSVPGYINNLGKTFLRKTGLVQSHPVRVEDHSSETKLFLSWLVTGVQRVDNVLMSIGDSICFFTKDSKAELAKISPGDVREIKVIPRSS
jgi:hypothetical protein